MREPRDKNAHLSHPDGGCADIPRTLRRGAAQRNSYGTLQRKARKKSPKKRNPPADLSTGGGQTGVCAVFGGTMGGLTGRSQRSTGGQHHRVL